MKLNRKLNAATMAAVAALTLSVPALAQAPTATPTPTPTATAPAPVPGSEITVTAKDGLVKAVEDATKTLAEGKVKEVTIKITTCDDQLLPPEINAKGKITILGCGADLPGGPGTDYRAKRTNLVVGDAQAVNGVMVKSPLAVSGVTARFSGVLFEAHSSLSITNSVFLNKRVEGNRMSRTIKGMLPGGKVEHEIMIDNVSFYHVATLSGETGGAKVTVKNALLHEIPEKDRYMLAFGPSKGESGPVLVENCEFDGHYVKDHASVLYIERPNVTVRNNFFYLDSPSDEGGGIRLMSPAADVGMPLKGVEITGNQFIGPVAIENPAGIPLGKDAVKITGNDFSKAEAVLPTKEKLKDHGTVSPKEAFNAQGNFWGKLPVADVMADTSGALTEAPKVPAMRIVNQLDGETRFETATRISSSTYRSGAKTVILARADNVSDSVSAVPLADELDAPILLTQSTTLHEAVAKEIKRLQPNGGQVILMGGEEALNKAVEEAVVKNGGKVERIAGANRAATAVETAKKLKAMNKQKEFVLVDGADWQPDLIAGPVAAKVEGATLLTNGDQMAPETAAYLKENASVKVTAIGDKAIKTNAAKEMVAGMEPTALSISVANQFFKDVKVIGMATTVDFADALAGGYHIAEKEGPLLLVPTAIPANVTEYLKMNPQIGYINVYGGETRFSEKVIEELGK
ncbi:cell wall-binding repeat-containing protein [Stomatohabitans albus]|uniref:cell wall-binding repeat-containing protein n=1 Tax=Stomatohabitans albus TaxID=3110766 RepID=UPI00300C32FE